jgi:hypothetical protein
VVIPEDKFSDPRYKYIPELRGREFTSISFALRNGIAT